MGAFSMWHWLIILVVVLVLFGGSGKVSSLMGDVAKGIKSFKKGMADDDDEVTTEQVKTIDHDMNDVDGTTVKTTVKEKTGS